MNFKLQGDQHHALDKQLSQPLAKDQRGITLNPHLSQRSGSFLLYQLSEERCDTALSHNIKLLYYLTNS